MATSTPQDGTAGPSTVDRLLDERARRMPDRVAHVVHGSTRLTYGQWRRDAAAVAVALADRGVRRGTRVGLVFPRATVPGFATCLTAVHRLGAVAVLVPADDTGPERDELLRMSRCEVAVAAGVPGGTLAGIPVLDAEALRTADPGQAPPSAADPDDIATVAFTSGTTDTPKAVAMTHRDIMVGADAADAAAEPVTLLHAFPLSVPVGQWAAQLPLLRPATAVALAEFDPATFLQLVETYRATQTAVVPAVAAAMAGLIGTSTADVSSLRRVTIGSARCPQPALEAVRALFPDAKVEIDYSSTESGWAGTTLEYGADYVPGAVGRPRTGSAVRVVDEDGEPVPVGETGIIELRLPHGVPPRHYLDDPAATAATFRGRWVRMPDVGRLDEQGCLHLTARTRDFVNLSGRKVSCPEVERAFESFPGVVEAAAFGVEDPILGEDLGVAVVATGDVREEDLRRHASQRLASYKVPSTITVVPELPRTRSGKVRKQQLVERARRGRRRDTEPGGATLTALRRAVAEVTGTADPPADRTLGELGLTSIEVIRVHHRVAVALDTDIEVTALLGSFTIAELAGRLTAKRSAGPGEDG
jgi:long-chain acyl-CoA synthetase